MKLEDLLNNTGEWLKGTGPNSEIVVSSRIRLARNLTRIPFPRWADNRQKNEVLEKCVGAVNESNYFKGAAVFELENLGQVDRLFLVERHLMSHEHASGGGKGRALVVTGNEVVSVMINEEDHLRIQVMQSGFSLLGVWRVAETIDEDLGQRLDLAFSPKWGYLTSCPTNTGTGMRGSVMIHLPALVMTGQISKVLSAIAKLSLTARGFYGEGTEASGNFLQISNQVTLGQTESGIIDNIERVIRQVISYEENARETLLSKKKDILEDRIFRSRGLLLNARIVTSAETIGLLSTIRLGVELGLVKDISRRTINELLIMTQPAHLQKMETRELTPEERDVKRAQLIRDRLREKAI